MAKLNARFMVRSTDQELARLDKIVAVHGLKSRSQLVRTLIRRAGGLLQPDQELVEFWEQLFRSNIKIGSNINQIARRVNRGEMVLGEEAAQDLQECKKHLAELNKEMADTLKYLKREAPRVSFTEGLDQ